MLLRIVIVSVALLVAVGCARNQDSRRPLAVPALKIQESHFSGTVLSGPLSQSPKETPAADALHVDVKWLLLRGLPPVGETLGARADLILAQRQAQPVLPSTNLTVGGRVVTDSAAIAALQSLPAAQAVGVSRTVTALPAGATYAVNMASEKPYPQVQAFVSRPMDQLQSVELAVAVTDEVTVEVETDSVDPEAAATQPAPPPLRQVQRELAMVRLRADQSPIALIVPVSLSESPAKFVAIIVELSPGSDDPAHVDALARAREEMTAAAKVALTESAIDPAQSIAREISSALSQAQTAQRRRSSIVFLATANAAPIAADMAMLADDALLERFVALLDQQSAAGQSMSPTQWSLALDLVALKCLGELQAAGKLPPEMQSLLVLHTGEVGRRAGTIDEIVAGVGSREELNARIQAENLIYLADHSPAARVRAFDWLTARNAAPEDFDPLADTRARRAALERASTRPAKP